MTPVQRMSGDPGSALVRVTSDPGGRFTAQIVGLPEIQATAPTREEAIDQVRSAVASWVVSGQLLVLDVPATSALSPWFGWAKDDPEHDDFREEIRRQREALDEAPQESEGGPCSDTSSTPTT
jgi:hypothetical protein